ncbi:MAG TPA: HEAT repeat domain-containing protein, partial [Terriglobales bacterium]|nr:HEAT repeat domain-containing protein [Terriglobales bacterium]
IHPVASMQSGTKSWYSLRLTTKAGRKLNLVDGVADRQEARWLVSQIETLAGLKQDTRVEFNDFYGPPPQRGVTPAPNALPARRGSPWIAVVIFVAWLGFIVSRFVLPISRATHASTSVRPKTTAVQVLPRTFAPMTDADAERISVLPLQDQAEELLERSIEHDQRALDLFESHLADYKGRVKESARMKQLLNRAQYSRDLRVRYAYSDMMLAMDGWSRDSDAVQILLDRAKHDASSRAYDLWFLGMLGGRGVEPEQIRAALLDYAHSDPDAQVRQWATEGLGFVGTDQALDSLFDIFVSDPSYNVRDRAGCNMAEGGDFTRKQRMRIFPKFLELAENSTTNSQMRNWSFLAMQEITEVNLPSDAKVWRNWYEEHGVEKLAEFESLPEWQVRGDE